MAKPKFTLQQQIDNLKAENGTLTSELEKKDGTIRSLRNSVEAAEARSASAVNWLQPRFMYIHTLLALLHKVAWLADAQKAHALDGSRPGNMEQYSEDGLSTVEGRSTLADRVREEHVTAWLAQLCNRIEGELQPRGPVRHDPPGGPQCWRRECKARGLKQGWDQTVCRECGEGFGKYRPMWKLSDAS